MSGSKQTARVGASKGVRRALLIGASAYQVGYSLKTPQADVAIVRTALEARGFKCEAILEPDYLTMKAAVAKFAAGVSQVDLALIFYAGHGYEHAGSGTVLPIDFPFPATGGGLHRFGYPVSLFEDALRECRGAGILILDACRVPLEEAEERRRWTEIAVSSPNLSDHRELLTVWSTSSGDIAWDGVDENSLFAANFSKLALSHNLDLEELFTAVGREVEASPRRQRSWYRSSLKQRYLLSDLPQHQLAENIFTHLPARAGPLWLARNCHGDRLLACGQSRIVFEVSSGSLTVAGTTNSAASVLAAEWLPQGLAILDDAPSLHVRGSVTKSISLQQEPYALRVTPDGHHALLFGRDRLELVELQKRRLRVQRRWHLDWCPYGVTFQNDQTAWVVGSKGMIAKLDAQSAKLAPLTLPNSWAGHLYDVAVLENDDLAVVSGRGGFRILRPQPGAPDRLASLDGSNVGWPEPPPVTPAFLTILSARHGEDDLLFCDVAPGLPLLAAGSSNGNVVLIDLRDGQTIRTLSASTGDDDVQGLAFLDDGSLAVLGRDATVRFARPDW